MSNRSEQSRRSRVQVLAAELYREHRERLLRIARCNAANPEDADEAVQFAFLSFLEKFDVDCDAPPIAWLTLVTKRACWAKHKREHLDRRVSQEVAPGSDQPGFSIDRVVSEAPDAEESIERAEWLLDARQRLAQLKPDERRALALIGAGYSYAEIGAALDWTHCKTNRCAAEGRAALRESVGA